jgi:hypothetical protein
VAWLKKVLEFFSLLAEERFSAPPNCNRQPDDRHFFFASIRLVLPAPHACGWSTPAHAPPLAPFSTCCYLLLAPCSPPPTTPPAALSVFNSKSLPFRRQLALPDLRW